MDSRNTISLTEARKRIFDLAKEVQKPGTIYILTEKGRAKVVMLSAEEFESWQETIEVMNQFPDLDKDVEEAEKDLRQGKTVSLEDILAEHGYVLADKGKEVYASRRVNKKRKKRSRKNTQETSTAD
ncbi:MAG: type II toxin-antitoxin system Phd/YefM family antitoxin [bacterium]